MCVWDGSIISCDFPIFQKLPPHIPSSIPYLGHAISFGQTPIEFLIAAYQRVSNLPFLFDLFSYDRCWI